MATVRPKALLPLSSATKYNSFVLAGLGLPLLPFSWVLVVLNGNGEMFGQRRCHGYLTGQSALAAAAPGCVEDQDFILAGTLPQLLAGCIH